VHRLPKVQPQDRLALKGCVKPLCLVIAIDHVQRGLGLSVLAAGVCRLTHEDLLTLSVEQQHL
jgi:hypothetical protein